MWSESYETISQSNLLKGFVAFTVLYLEKRLVF